MRDSDPGFTLIEMMLAVCVIGLLSSMAVFEIGAARPGFQGDGAMRVVMGELNTAREIAVAQRRDIRVEFLGTRRIRITRLEFPSGETVLSDLPLESGVEFRLVEGTGDTPDGFGNSAAVKFGSAVSLSFNTEGALVDSGGTPVNGSVFLAINGQPLSARAVTVLGSTGRVRGYRWDGRAWRRV
jgi:prepilin-type N-terminal cleavage/methylation domain-containing protein